MTFLILLIIKSYLKYKFYPQNKISKKTILIYILVWKTPRLVKKFIIKFQNVITVKTISKINTFLVTGFNTIRKNILIKARMFMNCICFPYSNFDAYLTTNAIHIILIEMKPLFVCKILPNVGF